MDMSKRKNIWAGLMAAAVIVAGLSVAACAPAADKDSASGAGEAITVGNDTVVAGEAGKVTDPSAGGKVGNVTSGGVEFDSLGSSALPEPYSPPGDFLALALGTVPPISHGDANGDSCLSCHKSGAGGAVQQPASHKDAGVTDAYCRNCHKDA
jgi:hypothetical protein